MLTLITGRGKSGKTRLLLEAVKACPTTQMASRIVLVPEQLSHETERLLSELCGDSISFTAEVLSFTRLCDRVFARSGGGARPILDQGGRILTAISAGILCLKDGMAMIFLAIVYALSAGAAMVVPV